MTEVERTPVGLQTVIPGCERRTLPKSTTRAGEDGQGFWIAALLLCLVGPVSAKDDDADCDKFAKAVSLFNTEKKEILAEYEGAVKTNPRKANGLPRENPVACRALRKAENATLLFLGMDDEYDECIESGKDKFLKSMKSIYDSTATLEASYCSKEELHKPVEETKTEKCFYHGICN